jgi:hypothetical protein
VHGGRSAQPCANHGQYITGKKEKKAWANSQVILMCWYEDQASDGDNSQYGVTGTDALIVG